MWTIQRYLVVEDENLVREMIVDVLTEAGFEVDEASTGDDAAKLIDADGYSLILYRRTNAGTPGRHRSGRGASLDLLPQQPGGAEHGRRPLGLRQAGLRQHLRHGVGQAARSVKAHRLLRPRDRERQEREQGCERGYGARAFSSKTTLAVFCRTYRRECVGVEPPE